MTVENELEFLELAAKTRKVRTPEGAKKYGQPIGTIITADMIEYAKKTNPDIDAPEDSDKGAVSAKSSSTASSSKPLHGPSKFKVAGGSYSAPKGSRLFRAKNGNLAYVRTPNGEIRAFNADGEVEIPENLKDFLSTKFSDSFKGDDLYELGEFDETEDEQLSNLASGTSLLKDGEVAFVKRDDGLWENPVLGALFTDSDLQSSYDAGKFEVQAANVVDTDFSKMSWDEINDFLESAELGKELYFNNIKVTKEEAGWKSEKTGLHLESDALADLSVDTDFLGEKPKSVNTGDNNDEAESNSGGSDGVSDVPGSGGGNSGIGGSDGSGDSADEGDEPLDETHAGFVVPKETLDKIVDLLDESRKIAATKQALIDLKSDIKKVTKGWGIAEAKAIVDSIEKKYAFYVDGKRVRTLKKFTENDRTADIQAAGGSTPPVYHLEKSKKNAKLFRDQMVKSLEGNDYSASVYVYSEEEYADMDLFLADDGMSGIALHNGDEIVSVFSSPDSEHKKVARHLISVAVQNGGTRLDAFDTVLPKIYAAEGFKVKARLRWNDDYAPDGWNKSTFSKFNGGEPDVVFMEYDPSAVNGSYTPGEGPYVDTYDEGLAATSGGLEDTDSDETPEVGSDSPDEEPEVVESATSILDGKTEFTDPSDLDKVQVGSSVYVQFSEDDIMVAEKIDDDTYQDTKYNTIWDSSELSPLIQSNSTSIWGDSDESSAPMDDTDVSMESQNEPLADWELELLNDNDPDQPQATDEPSGVEGMETSEVESAIEALESHTGFQIKYGLKSLPETHPLKNQDFLDATVADAKEDFPNLSPKKALIAHLKAGIGQTDEAVQPVQEEDTGPSILIGSDDPKNTATGVTGGSFSAKDIQDAVDILENYNGKLFKAELNKKGNPLGQLSPNDIVGFNKDKTITKQKFIDLLKKKLADNKPVETAESPSVSDPDKLYTEEELSKLSKEEVAGFPLGKTFEHSNGGNRLEKTGENQWSIISPEGKIINTWDNEKTWETFNQYGGWSSPDIDSEDSQASALAQGDKILSEEVFTNLPVGSRVAYHGYKGDIIDYYIKTDENSWNPEGGDDGLEGLKDSAFVHAINAGWLTYSGQKDTDESLDTDADDASVEDVTANYENGHALISDPAAEKIGGQAGSNEGGLYSLPTVDGPENYYVKKAKTADHGNNEALANALYAELGVNAPEVDFASDGNLYSKIVDGEQDMNSRLNDPEWLAKVQKDFAIDAWLSNRDVFGMTYDNILTDEDGNPWRIDNGGALLFRAMGEKKTDFGPQVTELAAFKTGKKAKVFGPDVMDEATERDGAKRLSQLSPDRIREMVAEHNLPDSLADTLVARRQYILDAYNISDPFAEQNDIPNFNGSIGEKVDSEEKFNSLPVGTVVALPLYNGNEFYFTKREDGWYGEVENKTAVSAILAFAETEGSGKQAYVFKTPEPKSESEPEQTSVHDIAPGKYNTGKGAKAHLWVKPDGTGVYQGMKNKLIELDAEAVKKNFDAGMSNLVDTPDLSAYPDPNADTPVDETVEAKKVIKPLGTVDTLPDGSYTDAKGVEYTVKGDEVVVSKALKALPFSDLTVGKSPTYDFLVNAPSGTKVVRKGKYHGEIFVKNAEGVWEPEDAYTSAWIKNEFKAMAEGASYYNSDWKIVEFPGKDETTVKKSAIKTKYLKGELLDADGSSVYPPGHSGNVTYYGAATTVEALDSFKKFMADPDNDFNDKAKANILFGVPFENPKAYQQKLLEKLGKEQWDSAAEKFDAIVNDIDAFLATANVPAVQSPADLFEKDSQGFSKKPLEMFTIQKPSSYASVSEWNEYNKKIAALVGDGTVIGHLTGASKYDKKEWATYVLNGNFAAAYKIEAAAYVSKNKPHPSGSKHPGHPSNPATHQIVWGAAVEGEIPAGQTIPGEWTTESPLTSPSIQELDNYLIAAKMQNPEYLSTSEKRVWVLAHKQGNKSTVDSLSATALQRKQNGHEKLSSAPVWSDDVKPAKSYDKFFDDTQFPQIWDGYSEKNAALDYLNDFAASNEELNNLWQAKKNENPWGYDTVIAGMTLNEYFAAKEAEYLEELNKPVYTVHKEIAAGSHSVFIVKDQFDRMKIFKPLSPGKEWRSENEAANHEFLKSLGFNVPGAKIGSVFEGLPMGQNTEGVLMDYAPNVGDLGDVDGSPVDLVGLDPKQLGQLAAEHVADWFIDNDDTHAENILVGTAGDLIAVDKGRALLQYGHWHGLDVDNPDSMNVNTASSGRNIVYFDMIQAIKSGQMSQEQIDAMYKSATRAAKRIAKQSDARVEEFVRSATANRTNWDVPDYAKDWDVLEPHPTNQDELVAAVLKRKNAIVTDIEDMWTKLYSYAGLPKPEVPAKALGEAHSSGWHEADLHQKISENKVFGVGAIHASGAFADGASLLWTEKTTDGKDVTAGKFKLGNITQQNVLSFLSKKVSPSSGAQPTGELLGFPSNHVKSWKKTVTAAAKNVSQNATTGVYDSEIWQSMKETEKQVDADLAYASTVDTMSDSNVTFPSGVSVPAATVPQYVLALQHHKNLVAEVEKAKENKVATDKSLFKDYQPPQWKVQGLLYTHPDGESYKQLESGMYLHNAGGVVTLVSEVPADVKAGENGWTSHTPAGTEDGLTDPEKYTLSNAGMQSGVLDKDGKKTQTGNYTSNGNPGHEYRIDLPTGEVIFFRNSDTTGTVKSQQGTVRFELNPDADAASSLQNVENYLEKWGLELDGADEDSIENVYWRQMFKRVIDSNTASAPAGVQSAKSKLLNMKSQLESQLGYSMNNRDIPEAISLTSDDENEFWTSLAAEAFGADKVNQFLAEGGHLPQYSHMDLTDTKKNTGLPYFNRIDVDLSKIYDKGTMVAIGNNGKDDRHFDYIKSGGMASTEERLRILGTFKQGASSGEDQKTGGANSVFTRVAKGSALKNGALYGAHVAYWSPKVMQQIGTYSFDSDQYGKIDNQHFGNQYDPLESLNYSSTGNETMVANTLAIYDFLEIMVFEDENKRLKAIEEFKKLGIEELRGVPIEDRLVLRVNLTKAMNTVKAAWSA